MYIRIFKHEFRRNIIINMTLLFFIALSALLVASAIYVMMVLSDGVDQLLSESKIPHYIQMHNGEIEHNEISQFNASIDYIENFQLVEMVGIDGSEIYIGNSEEAEVKSVMDISMVIQNSEFDYLLNLDNDIIHVDDTQIAVPIYYKNKKQLSIGDIVKIDNGEYQKKLTISAFVRDAQMNPSLVSSKRFLISEKSFQELKDVFQEREYILEYRFDNRKYITEFANIYYDSSMPKNGPAVDYNLFKILNALTDGIIVLVLILISVLLIVIGLLCLRFSLLGVIEEDVQEIGVMKAIGLSVSRIQMLYMSKYVALAIIACIIGYLTSFAVNQLFITNIAEYMGTVSPRPSNYLMPLAGVVMIFSVVVMSCFVMLRRFKKLSAVNAITLRHGSRKKIFTQRLKLHRKKYINIDVFLGLNAVYSNIRSYILMIVIFLICTFIVIVPSNILNTMKSKEFTNYMGVSRSDIRIDIRQSEEVNQKIDELISTISQDDEVTDFTLFKTYRFKVLNDELEFENIPIETGELQLFPLEYFEGYAPQSDEEIAVSVLAAESLGKTIGDKVEVIGENNQYLLTITGIYQDITNGGKTAKAKFKVNDENVLWNVININLTDHKLVNAKLKEYISKFEGVKVTDIQEYLNQTLGATLSQLQVVTVFAVIVALAIAILITVLFLKMLLMKETRDIGILVSLGFSRYNIIKQYLSRVLLVLGMGVMIGIYCSATIGEILVSGIGSGFGASRIVFIVNPWLVYGLYPFILCLVVVITAIIIVSKQKTMNISRMIVE